MPTVFIAAGKTKGHSVSFDSEATIGRVSSCTVRFEDGQASREHAAIAHKDSQWHVRDLGSRNGTSLNGKRLTKERLLKSGDRITVGDTVLVFFTAATIPLPGDQVGAFEILEPLRSKSDGYVFRARQKSLDRTVALEILDDAYASDEEFVRDFEETARVTGDLHHPSIIQLYDIGEHSGFRFAALEDFHGETLRSRLEAGEKLSIPQAADLLGRMLEALDAIHARDLVHGNINPQNVLLAADGQVKVTDVSKGRLAGKLSVDEHQARWLAQFISPEEARYLPLTSASDIYSLGCVAYMLFSGEPPVSGSSSTAIIRGHAREPITALKERSPRLPDGLCALVDSLLAKDAGKRPDTAAKVDEALKAATREQRRSPSPMRADRPSSREIPVKDVETPADPPASDTASDSARMGTASADTPPTETLLRAVGATLTTISVILLLAIASEATLVVLRIFS